MHKNLERPVARSSPHLLAIDPGLSGTGYAFWKTVDEDTPTDVGVIPVLPRSLPFDHRAGIIASYFDGYLIRYPPLTVVCEYPEFQESAHREMGWRTGDLQKLTFLVGAIAGRLWRHWFYPVMPHVWKGQLPKNVVAHRIAARLGTEWVQSSGVKTHAWDAVGIGLWWREYGRQV